MDIYDLVVYKVKRPIYITLSKRFLKNYGMSSEGVNGMRHGKGWIKNVLVIGDILDGCSLKSHYHCEKSHRDVNLSCLRY